MIIPRAKKRISRVPHKLKIYRKPGLNWRANWLNRQDLVGLWSSGANVFWDTYDSVFLGFDAPGRILNDTGALNDSISFEPIYLEPLKKYQFEITYARNIDAPIITIYYGTQNIGSYDLYNGSLALKTSKWIFTNTTQPPAKISIKATSKNVLSSGYMMTLSLFHIIEVNDDYSII